MKKVIYAALIMLCFASCAKANKIGFIDNGSLINDYQEKIDIEAKFKGKDEAFRKKADSIGTAFQDEVKKAQAKAQRSSQRKAQELMAGLQKKQQSLQQEMQNEQQALTVAFQSEIDSVIVKIKDYVKDYGKTNGYTYILGTSDAAASVLYGAEENDLTKTVLEALNADYKK